MGIDMESNDNPKRKLADQEKECYDVFLFIVNQGFQRLLMWLTSSLHFEFLDYVISLLAVLSTLFRIHFFMKSWLDFNYKIMVSTLSLRFKRLRGWTCSFQLLVLFPYRLIWIFSRTVTFIDDQYFLFLYWSWRIKTLDKRSETVTFVPHIEMANKTSDIPSSKSEPLITKTRTKTLILFQLMSV